MSASIISSNISPTDYNNKVQHPLQTWEWGTAKEAVGNKIVRFSDKSINYLMTLHEVPHTKYSIGYLARSPLLTSDCFSFLKTHAIKHNIIFIKIEPYVKADTLDDRWDSIMESYDIQKSPHPLFPDWTITLDLKPSEDELLKRMKSKTRYNIRLAVKKGLVVREQSDEDGFDIFSKLYFETTKRQRYFGHNRKYHQVVWDNLKNNIAHLLIAYYNDEPLAAYELFVFNKTIYYPYGGTSTKHRNFMAANLLMWESIRLGKKLGAEVFDMWGSLGYDYDKNDSWAGFTKFKEGYGGEFTQMMGSYDLVINKPLYRLYNTAQKVRNWYLQIRA